MKSSIEELANQVLEQQSFKIPSFREAKTTISVQKYYCTFDRISLCVYSHNLSSEEYYAFGNILTQKFEANHSREEQKTRTEYGVLFHLIILQNIYTDFIITKQERPDFILNGNKNEKIGIEVTEFTTERDSVISRISKQNFRKGFSALELKDIAFKTHGSKAKDYEYYDLGNSIAIGTGLINVIDQHKKYADEIIKKFNKYKTSFSLYDKFIVLCNGQHSMCLSSFDDSASIVSLAKEKEPMISGFTLHILRVDHTGTCVVDTFTV